MGKNQKTMEYKCQFDVGIELVYNVIERQGTEDVSKII